MVMRCMPQSSKSLSRRQCLSALLATLAAACQPVKLLNAIIPTRQMQAGKNIAYGQHPRQQLDIYQPKANSAAKGKLAPVVIFFYGGSWDSGSKDDYLFVAEALVSRGYVTVIADYRLYPEVKFPALMQDPAMVVDWVARHIADFSGNPQQLFLMGHSAGAHLAVMLSVNAAYLQAAGTSPAILRGCIGLAGPYDFLPLTSDRLKAIFAPESEQWRSQPVNFVDGKQPPMFLLMGLKDTVVWPRNTLRMADAVQRHGGEVKVSTYPDYNHVDMVAKLARPLRGSSDLLENIDRWIQAHVQPS